MMGNGLEMLKTETSGHLEKSPMMGILPTMSSVKFWPSGSGCPGAGAPYMASTVLSGMPNRNRGTIFRHKTFFFKIGIPTK